jgi:hypothetical protein
MQILLFLLNIFCVLPWLTGPTEVGAQSRKVIMAYTSISPQYAPAWIAKEKKIFEKNGVSDTMPVLRKYLRIQNAEELQYVYQFYAGGMVEKPTRPLKAFNCFWIGRSTRKRNGGV